jgi:hypothetical protein
MLKIDYKHLSGKASIATLVQKKIKNRKFEWTNSSHDFVVYFNTRLQSDGKE